MTNTSMFAPHARVCPKLNEGLTGYDRLQTG